jgi:hypothetical protein
MAMMTSGVWASLFARTSFSTISTPFGTSPVADSTDDILALQSTDNSITINGDETTDTINLTVLPDVIDHNALFGLQGGGGDYYHLSATAYSYANSLASFYEGGILFGPPGGGFPIQDTTILSWDDTNDRLGVGLNTPESKIHSKSLNGTVGPADYGVGGEFFFGYESADNVNYLSGDYVDYRLYAKFLENGAYYYSQNYISFTGGPVTIVSDYSSVYLEWDPATPTGGATLVGYLLVRNYNGAGFIDYYETPDTTNYIFDGNGAVWLWTTPLLDINTTASFYINARLCYDDGVDVWSGHFDNNVWVGGNIGVNFPTPTSKVSVYESDNTKTAFLVKRPQGSSVNPASIALQDEYGYEVFGMSAWNGGGSTGGYGALTLGSYNPSGSVRWGEISPKNSYNGLRCGSIIFQTDSVTDSSSFEFYPGKNGAFLHAMSMKDDGRCGMHGKTSPSAWLHLSTGSTTAGQAPLKWTSGSLLSTPEAGAAEFLTDKFYGTITTGAARKEFTLNDVALTSGRIPFITTNGRLTDDSSLTYSTSTGLTIADKNIVLGTTTGTKIGTATTQKLGFYNATPIVQPSSTTDLRTALINLGLYATGGATPLDLNGGAFTTSGVGTFSGTTDSTSNSTGIVKVSGGLGVAKSIFSGGDIACDVAGKGFKVKEGSNAKMGTATLVAGTVTVSTTAVTASSRVYLTIQTNGGTVGVPYVSARTAGTSFAITSTSGTDTSTVAWILIEPA